MEANTHRILVICLTLLISCSLLQKSHGQNIITGKITDTQNQSLCYANIINIKSKYGTVTDTNGNYRLEYKNSTDTIKISYLGYNDLTISIEELINTPNLKLTIDRTLIDEITISKNSPKYKTKLIGKIPSKVGTTYYASPGYQKATKIEYSKKLIGGKLTMVHFSAKFKDECSNLLRIRFKKVMQNGFPGKDILNDNLVIDFKNDSGVKQYAIDISNYDIKLTDKHIFVVFEWLNTGSCSSQNPMLITHLPKNNGSSYSNFMDTKWIRTDHANAIKVGLKVKTLKE